MSAIVLGGGIAGLSASYYLSRLSPKPITLVEGSSRLGGWIKSVKTRNGTNFEVGPRTMRVVGVAGMNTLQLLEELNMSNEVRPVLKSQPAAKNRMLYVGGQLHSLPNTFGSLFKIVPPFTKPLATALLRDLRASAVPLEDDSIYGFVARRLGEEIADYAVSALVCGVCAGDAKKISVNLLMSSLFQWEQEYGGITKGLIKSALKKTEETSLKQEGSLSKEAKSKGWSVWSLHEGLERLPKRMGEVLEKNENVKILLESPCDGIQFNDKGAEVSFNGRQEKTNHIYCGIPSIQLSKILPPKHQELKVELSAIPFVTVGVVNLEYDGQVLPVEGFGFLVPPNQNLKILGVIFDTCCFPQDGKTVLTVMMGGAWFQEHFGLNPDPQQLAAIAIDEVKKALNITRPPADTRVSILENCIPQYVVGHKARVDRIRRYIKEHKLPLTLIGSSYDGVGVNDVILSARKGVELQT